MLDAEPVQVLTFRRRSRSRVNLHARSLRKLYRGEADAAGGRMNQHALSLAHSSEIVQGVVSGDEGNGNRCGFSKRQVFRFRYNQRSNCRGERAEAGRGDRDHFIADSETFNTFTDSADATGTLPAEINHISEHWWQQPESQHHISKIEPNGENLNFDFSVGECLARNYAPGQIVEYPRCRSIKPEGHLGLNIGTLSIQVETFRRRRCRIRRELNQSCDESSIV